MLKNFTWNMTRYVPKYPVAPSADGIRLYAAERICITCGRVSSWKNRPTFEELAVMFESSTADGAERAYKKVFLHLAELLISDNAVHPIHLKLKSRKSRNRKFGEFLN